MARKSTTIFKQLIFNVVSPAITALLFLGTLNYQHTKNILVQSAHEKNQIISDEIRHIHELQDLAMEILQDQLNPRMEEISNKLVDDYFADTRNIEEANLYRIRNQLGMNPDFEDIYIINSHGIVVNTTFKADSGLNLFNFGIEHKQLLEEVMKSGEYVSERFAVEASSKRLKKYTYQATKDGRFIVELGIYSPKADEIIDKINERLNNLSVEQEGIESVCLFIVAEEPFSLVEGCTVSEEEMPYYRQVLHDKANVSHNAKIGKQWITYEYMYMYRKNTDLYKEAVIRIISDRSKERTLLRRELVNFLLIFGLALVVVMVLLYRKTRVITDPIKKLVENVNRITNGHMNERAEVIGNNEITSLSVKFNLMIEQLESYYNELEEKVRVRTAEIEKNRVEIEAQRDSLEKQRNMLSKTNASLQEAYTEIEEKNKHIEDSIRYAKRIQNAILPPDEYVDKLLENYFILYKPKDIVSGDFYWVNKKDGMVYIAAVDCTGHGVPGAFMSIVGHDQLDYAVNVSGARRPAEILDALNQGVTATLRQTRTVLSVKDGMDIALCGINFKKKKLEYAGAFNPMYLLRDNELTQVKANKFPVGAFIGEELSKFTNNELDIRDGDVVYIFSDGYADQFGGPDNRKFLSKRFRDMLLDIHKRPAREQRDILDQTIEDWKGQYSQVDDILVIGILF